MTKYREILRLHSQGISNRSIAVSLECSRNTIRKVLGRAEEEAISWPLPEKMTDKALEQALFGNRRSTQDRKQPDFEYIHREMAKNGVTLSLLWNEYCETCRREGSHAFMYSRFCDMYQQFAATTKATLHVEHKPGERMEVDWAGDTTAVQDIITGKPIPVYVFVAVLPCSGYAYVEGFLSQNQESWVTAHVHAYQFFGGVTRILVPDNLKTGVQKADWYSPVINKTYHELAEHYGTAVIPAGVRKPREKPSVEATVGNISTWIIAALRNRQFLSLPELNGAIWNKLSEFNRKPFQKKPGSRESAFAEERLFLMALPAKPFEMSAWKVATVQFNYHIATDKMYYSVPYEYIKHTVDIRLTGSMVEVFYQGKRIASHRRLHGYPGQYSTVAEHMPEKHRQYTQWNAERFIRWAADIGPNTEQAVKALIASRKVEQQSYKSCIALLKLADTHPVTSLEAACKKALAYSIRPSFRSIRTILTAGQSNRGGETAEPENKEGSTYGFTRGKVYYGGTTDGE
ncbi:IS21 family transposase [Treponema primitia]|uniref:IS21 family transposase n=1 Tax=Treponema primitia TaxID=88058 RepID=UPI0039809E65